jgi:UDP-N-acetylmuramate dehydrogenase
MLNKAALVAFDCQFDVPLSAYTYTEVGGPADILAFPHSVSQLMDLIALASADKTAVTVLGNASNLIVRDGGIRGLVIRLDRLDLVNVAGFALEVQAGTKLTQLAKVAQQHALAGLEFACGIPGSVGGAIYMNAGAYGGEISNVLSSAKILDLESNEIKVLTKSELQFGYRSSILREKKWIVLSAKFELAAGDPTQIQNEMNRLDALRAAKQPLEYPSCGSVFKRPAGHFAGPLIQAAGCQGLRVGGVEVSRKHAGFMVNIDHARAKDYEDLIADVIEKVRLHSGIRLEPEVRIIGDAL